MPKFASYLDLIQRVSRAIRIQVNLELTPNAPACEHRHNTLKAGDICPACGRGKLYEGPPRQRLLFVGQPPITPVRHIFRDLFCSLCKEVFPASPSEEPAGDGLGEQDRYGHSAIAMMAVIKFFSMLPYYRLDRLSSILGVHIASSTQFDQIEILANVLKPVYNELLSHAANASLIMADDATAKIMLAFAASRRYAMAAIARWL